MSEKLESCIFCDKIAEQRDPDNLILYRAEHAYIIMNLYPYTNGHLMVIPYRHVSTMEALEAPTLTEMGLLINRSLRALRRVLGPQGFNVGANIGKVAGAGIDEHFHMHIVPRWQGDSNFMPVLGETRLIPETLRETYDRLIASGIASDPPE